MTTQDLAQGLDRKRHAVLIVDDVADNLLALEGMLRQYEVEVITALSGRAALEILLERDVAVALIDVQMPEMDGFELAALMRGSHKTHYVPIIFVTAGSREDARVFKGYESGAVDYLCKPVDDRILRGKVDVFVALASQRQQLREANEQLTRATLRAQQMTDELLEAARLRELFVGILAHDLRNPLSGMHMAAQLVLGGSNDEATTEALRGILLGADRMTRMIEQLLDVSRCRIGGGISISPKPCDLHEITAHACRDFVDVRERLHVETIGDTAGVWDEDRLLQIVSNLLGNAVHHGNVTSPIRVQLHGDRSDTVVLHVHNDGAPIPQELRGVLFEAFRGAEALERGRKTERLGLGLYITNQIVLAHGGTLSFESSDERGTCFTMSIPRHVGPDARFDTAARDARGFRPEEGSW